jgi:hypothetical protein
MNQRQSLREFHVYHFDKLYLFYKNHFIREQFVSFLIVINEERKGVIMSAIHGVNSIKKMVKWRIVH